MPGYAGFFIYLDSLCGLLLAAVDAAIIITTIITTTITATTEKDFGCRKLSAIASDYPTDLDLHNRVKRFMFMYVRMCFVLTSTSFKQMTFAVLVQCHEVTFGLLGRLPEGRVTK